jgi:hypothetical protein
MMKKIMVKQILTCAGFEWQAWTEGSASAIGYGATKKAAIREYLRLTGDRLEYRASLGIESARREFEGYVDWITGHTERK